MKTFLKSLAVFALPVKSKGFFFFPIYNYCLVFTFFIKKRKEKIRDD